MRSLAPQLAPQPLDLAIRHYVDHRKRLDNEDVVACIQLAGVFVQSFSNVAPTSTATQVVASSAPAAAIGSHQLALKILPQIQEIRQKFFARTDPPFSSWVNAEGWLKEAGEKQVFEGACQALAAATGFAHGDVQRYVLVGSEPYLSHVEVTLHSRPYHTDVQVSFYWSFSDKDVRIATREVRKALGVSRLKGVTNRDRRLLELIQQVGEPPSISNTPYWRRLQLLLNADTTIKPYPSPKAVETHYRRLPEKLRRSLPSHPATPTK